MPPRVEAWISVSIQNTTSAILFEYSKWKFDNVEYTRIGELQQSEVTNVSRATGLSVNETEHQFL